ncbi:MAG: ArsB/NhaD family transporter [Alicyclobacillaceae bacterium]|nr:ArsB/NhaD family transporter [Alicyclobacillaceae bacterium]
MERSAIVAVGIFVATYALMISERIHRTVVAMMGGILMILFGIVDQETAVRHIDFNTLGLLIGMMIIVNITAQTGLFSYLAVWAAKKAKGEPVRILAALGILTAAVSAFLDNVTTVLLMVPVTFSITRQLRVPPFPYLMTQVLASNIGGTATLIGDPPNIMIGSANPELTFLDFLNHLGTVSAFILLVTVGLLAVAYRRSLQASPERKAAILELDEKEEIADPGLLKKCLAVLGLTVGGFFLHQALHLDSATIALAGAFLLLSIAGEKHLEHALAKVEWTTIFFFAGLFVVVSGLVETGVISTLARRALDLTGGDLTATAMLILWMSALVSAFVDNIPFVATMIPMIQEMGSLGMSHLDPLWWSLALGACLGGNGTLIGASANVIVAGMAEKEGHRISFLHFLKVGFPLMILSIVLSSVYVYLRYLLR